ncbi:MAG: phenylalanine--tRNA ligase subunit beta, partial [Phycisphaerales bacterium]
TPNPAPGPTVTGDVHALVALDNRVPLACPLFTARIIKGVKVGPSPAWLVQALAAVGQRSINNVVDVTNFIALELGQPTHVFDLAAIAPNPSGKPELVIRTAVKGETLKLLDGKALTLAGDEVVVADLKSGGGTSEGRVVSLAGVMGGADTEVTPATTDVLLEAATWDPVAVRRAARRFNIRTDAGYRFERTVDPRTIAPAAARAATLIARLAGGTLVPGAVEAGPSRPPNAPIRLRPTRCGAMLGVEVSPEVITRILESLEIRTRPDGADLLCTPPAFRPDLTREIDLIEEVARIHGLDKLPLHEKIAVRIAPPQPSESAMRELSRVLTGAGFYEAVTFTFVGPKQARPFLPDRWRPIEVCDERRKADPILRPSAIPSLLACRRANQDGGVHGDGASGVRLFETSAVFAQIPPTDGQSKTARGRAIERRHLALLADAAFPEGAKPFERKQAAVRMIRGVVESAVRTLGGQPAADRLRFEHAAPPLAAFDPAASGRIALGDQDLGVFGVIADSVQREHDLASPVVAAEVALDPILALFPPRSTVRTLPQFPSIERDLSLVVGESTAWDAIDRLVRSARDSGLLPLMDDFWFVTTFRGQQIGAGRKSVTLRMRFRDPADQRTLRHEEVDPMVNGLVARAKEALGATVRA